MSQIREWWAVRIGRLREQRGQALVELALVLTPLVLILVGIVELGFFFQARATLRDGVRSAARQASLCRSATTSSPTVQSIYSDIVDSSLANPPPVVITDANGNVLNLYNADGTPNANCVAGTQIDAKGTYNFSVDILGLFSIPATKLDTTAVAVIE